MQKTTTLFTLKYYLLMNYLSYVHRTFGEVTMKIHSWELGAILNLIAAINQKEEIISHVTIKGV